MDRGQPGPGPGARIVGLGIDLVDVGRVEDAWRRHGDRFLARVLHDGEREAVRRSPSPSRALAERFAIKEAVFKALRSGWAHGVRFDDVESLESGGRIRGVCLHGVAADRASRLDVARALAGAGSTGTLAWAWALLESGSDVTPDRGVR